jgi:hypothetical protein
MMKADSDQSDAIAEYLKKVWESGGDISQVSDKEAKEAVMEIRKNRHTNEYLKNSDIPKLSDEELELAVMDWMRSKVKDWFNPYQELKTLPEPCQTVYSCRTVCDEILNGGLNQLFFNSMLPFAEMSIEGFLELGAPKLSRVMEKALEIYRNHKHTFDTYNNGTVDGFSALSNENFFDELEDEEFILECNSINVAGYIRAKSVFFGDKTPDVKNGF